MVDRWEKHQIVLISHEYPNGKKSRHVGYIVYIDERGADKNGRQYVTLNPLPEYIAKGIREKYCTEEYNYQGHENCYSDRYGFACMHIHPDTTVVLGKKEGKRYAVDL